MLVPLTAAHQKFFTIFWTLIEILRKLQPQLNLHSPTPVLILAAAYRLPF